MIYRSDFSMSFGSRVTAIGSPSNGVFWHQVHQLLLHAPMIGVLSCCLFDRAAYLLAFLLVVPYLDCFHQGLIAVEYQFVDTFFVFAYQFLYVITVDEQWYMLAQRHGDGIRCIWSSPISVGWTSCAIVPVDAAEPWSHHYLLAQSLLPASDILSIPLHKSTLSPFGI